MARLIFAFIIVSLLLMSAYVYTQTTSTITTLSNPTPWKADPSKTTPGSDTVTIQSGSGVVTEVQISVDHNSAAAKLANCGGTTALSPGSTAVCMTSDPSHPVTITSDDLSNPAFGTYQIKTQ